MRRVIQRTITTTKIISLTITHSEEEVNYILTDSQDQLDAATSAQPDGSSAPGVSDICIESTEQTNNAQDDHTPARA